MIRAFGGRSLSAVLIGLLLATSVAQAESIFLSTVASETLGGITSGKQDVAEYDRGTKTATLAFDGNLFAQDENVDAFHLLGNGNFLLSTESVATLAGLTFQDGDIVEYDPVSQAASIFWSEDAFSTDPDIDAFSILSNGHYLLSTRGPETLGGTSFDNGDLVEYDPITGATSIFFSQALFAGPANINGVHALSSGMIILTTVDNETLGGLLFNNGSLALYDPVLDVATLYLDEGDVFAGMANIDAVSLPTPEPLSLVLLAIGGLVLFRRNQKNSAADPA